MPKLADNCMTKLLISCITISVILSFGAQFVQGQTPEMTPGTIQYPAAMPLWKVKTGLGISTIAMPAAIVQETASLHWPLFGFDAVMGLPSNFLAEGIVSFQFVSNQVELSGRWVYPITDRLHADAGLGVGYFFGQLKQFEFNNTIHGWFLYPAVRVGYDFGPLAVTAQGKISFISELVVHNGTEVASTTNNIFNGFSYRISIEQPFWKTVTFGIAFQMNYLKFYYPEWVMFPTFNRYFWIPEAQFWFTL